MKASETANVRPGRGGIVPPIETRFQPGNSANPGGRPAFKAFSQAMRRLAELTPEQIAVYKPKTAAEQVALATVQRAIEDPRFMTHLLDRTEGKVVEQVELSGGPQALQITLAEAVRPGSGAHGSDGENEEPGGDAA